MPEAIEIKRVLRFNEQTSCMKPELHVTFNADAIECDDGKLKSESKNIYLRKVFRSRLEDFYRDHPQVLCFCLCCYSLKCKLSVIDTLVRV